MHLGNIVHVLYKNMWRQGLEGAHEKRLALKGFHELFRSWRGEDEAPETHPLSCNRSSALPTLRFPTASKRPNGSWRRRLLASEAALLVGLAPVGPKAALLGPLTPTLAAAQRVVPPPAQSGSPVAKSPAQSPRAIAPPPKRAEAERRERLEAEARSKAEAEARRKLEAGRQTLRERQRQARSHAAVARALLDAELRQRHGAISKAQAAAKAAATATSAPRAVADPRAVATLPPGTLWTEQLGALASEIEARQERQADVKHRVSEAHAAQRQQSPPHRTAAATPAGRKALPRPRRRKPRSGILRPWKLNLPRCPPPRCRERKRK